MVYFFLWIFFIFLAVLGGGNKNFQHIQEGCVDMDHVWSPFRSCSSMYRTHACMCDMIWYLPWQAIKTLTLPSLALSARRKGIVRLVVWSSGTLEFWNSGAPPRKFHARENWECSKPPFPSAPFLVFVEWVFRIVSGLKYSDVRLEGLWLWFSFRFLWCLCLGARRWIPS